MDQCTQPPGCPDTRCHHGHIHYTQGPDGAYGVLPFTPGALTHPHIPCPTCNNGDGIPPPWHPDAA